jgi:hypothetical protein
MCLSNAEGVVMKLKPIRGFGEKHKFIKITVLGLFLTTFGLIIYKCILKQEKPYHGAVNGQIFESKHCHMSKQTGYCEKEGKVVIVDYYYQ